MRQRRAARKRPLRWLIAILLGSLVGAGALILREAALVGLKNDERLFSSVAETPRNRVALVLGCSPKVANGQPNLYFNHRMDAAAELFKAGRVDLLLVSGDNATRHYDEPTAMRAALIERQVPAEHIHLDYAGFRTFDSVVRAHQVFGLDAFTIVSQEFQNRRALYIARHFDLDAIAFNASDVSGLADGKTRLREFFARVKMVLDLFFLGTEPRFLGEPVEIG